MTDSQKRLARAGAVERAYLAHRERYIGFCTACAAWTTDGVAPDAEEYECEVCGEHAVMGADNWLMENV